MSRILSRHYLLYAAQFERARRVASVPFECLSNEVPKAFGTPTIIFSIGRCGSTLLASLLNASGVPTVSEPDIFTQIAAIRAPQEDKPDTKLNELLLRAAMGSFGSHLGERFAVKLRSQCNGIAATIARAVPESKLVLVLRDRVAWARSRYSAFGGEPEALARMYRWGIEAFHRLEIAGGHPKLIWYEDIVADPVEAVRQIGFADEADAGVERIQAVMLRDSQLGSSLDRKSVGGRILSDDQLQAFERQWDVIKPRNLISRYSLERVG